MALKIVWTDEANEGLDDIIEYLESNWTDREITRFFKRLEECIGNIGEAPERSKNSLRKPGTKEYQHSPQTTIFYSYNYQVINILKIWTNLKSPDEL